MPPSTHTIVLPTQANPGKTSVSALVDFEQLMAAPMFEGTTSSQSPLMTDIREQPTIVLKCMALAFYQAMHNADLDELSKNGGSESLSAALPFVTIRIYNYVPITPLKHLKANYIGKFISVKGTVVRVGNIKPFVQKMAFTCTRCEEMQVLTLPDGKYYPPTRCTNEECRSKSFLPCRRSEETQTIDFQTIRLQEIVETGLHESGRVPRTLECELMGDIVDSCVPGDIVVVTGEIKVSSTGDATYKSKKKEQAMFLLYLSVNCVTGPRSRNDQQGATQEDGNDNDGQDNMIDFSLKDLCVISMLQSSSTSCLHLHVLRIAFTR